MTTKSTLFAREPVWQEIRRGSHHGLPAPVQSWVYEPESLTKRLRHCFGDSIRVDLLFLRWRLPYLSETRQLGLPARRFALIREVMLRSGDKPLLLARTIIPEATLKAAHRNLSHLGTRPLGEVIFSYPDLERLTMDLACIPTSNWTNHVQDKADLQQAIWGRRTVYIIHRQPMLVSEFFLPTIFDCY